MVYLVSTPPNCNILKDNHAHTVTPQLVDNKWACWRQKYRSPPIFSIIQLSACFAMVSQKWTPPHPKLWYIEAWEHNYTHTLLLHKGARRLRINTEPADVHYLLLSLDIIILAIFFINIAAIINHYQWCIILMSITDAIMSLPLTMAMTGIT